MDQLNSKVNMLSDQTCDLENKINLPEFIVQIKATEN